MIKRLSQTGDTIVEVLIAVSIVSLVLTGAFSIANSSLKQIRMSQERGEAQRVAQATIERLDDAVASSAILSNPNPGTVAPFCINSANEYVVAASVDCKQQDLYQVVVTRRDATVPFTYSVVVSWDGLSGSPQRIAIDYRVGATKRIVI